MTAIAIAMISGALIAFGLMAIVWDLRGNRAAKEPVRPRRAATAAEADPPHANRDPAEAAVATVLPAARPDRPHGLAHLTHAIAAITDETENAGPELERAMWLEGRWHALSPMTDAAVRQVNAAIEPVGLTIDSGGEPGWSYGNRGFGVYRRVRLADASLAWLRVELTADRAMIFKLRAHRQEQALLNATAEVASDGIVETAIVEPLAAALTSAAQFAAWAIPRTEADRDAGAALWAEFSGLASAALATTNGALSEADAVLVPLTAPAFEPVIRRYRWPLSINHAGEPVALMYVERHPDAVEISVGAADAARHDLGRRQRIDVNGLTPHGLAEVMAASAWPSIADALAVRG